ncbi:translation initiation factor IF-3 [Candidatus Gracilibacteria bacterium CG2_30_37_12]|nr:MAG: translation initiation factor IF-3 [Candidatus Gracilibacteria bacterium CG2_30_37_12]
MAPKAKRTNENIRANKVQVIAESGEQLGIMSLSEAISKASALEMDIVEIGMQGGVVLTKMMDYGKFLFKQQKSQNKSHSKKTEVKTIKLTYKIGDHDLEIRKNQAIKFGTAGHPLKIILSLRGRENHYEALAMDKVNEFVASLAEVYKADGKVMKAGNNFSILLHIKKS